VSAVRLRRVVRLVLSALVFLLLVGATYQGVTTAIERRRFPFPGRLVAAGSHQLHLYCTGTGAPVVLLESPAAGMSASWAWVQMALSEDTRVCSYDRAGLGWSEARDAAFSADAVTTELHAMLEESGEPGPYVLAGHGFGALLARVYAARFPDTVSGLVLVDIPIGPAPRSRPPALRWLGWSPWLARAGALRLTRMLTAHTSGLPDRSAGALAAFLNRPDHLTRAARELDAWDEVAARAEAATLPVSLPVTRVASAGPTVPPFLSSREDAARVTAAVAARVRDVRDRAPAASHP
jgi:pimeloyl-ACP methyl ester carboxylesterase